MAQFDVFRYSRGGPFPLLLDVQTDDLARLDSRMVVPLAVRRSFPAKPIPRVHPIVIVDGVEYLALFHHLSAYPAAKLVAPIASLAHQRNAFLAALDFMFIGS